MTTSILLSRGTRVFTRSALALLLVFGAGACSDLLDTTPPDSAEEVDAIITPSGAHRALAGAYASLQNGYYYGGTMTHFGDLYSDNATHTGTFVSYQEASEHDFFADNGDVTGMWNNIYASIKRVNTILAKVPNIEGFDEAERDQVLGEAHFLRALHYHNLVKYFGAVPLRLVPVNSPDQIEPLPRSPVADVYAQIIDDLEQSLVLMTDINENPGHATIAAANALLARVYLYQGQYALALTAAQQLDGDFSLAPIYGELFRFDVVSSSENIFTLTFTSNLAQASLLGYYWLSDGLDVGAGRYELAPTQDLIDAYDTTSADLRFAWNIAPDPGEEDGYSEGAAYGNKYRSPGGAEDFHVIRYAEVILIKAEAFARTANLDSAVANYNLIRERAGLDPHVLGVDVTTEAEVLAAIDHERRLEFFEEGDRFPDLTRDPVRAVQLLELPGPNRLLFPIPQAEIDIAPEVVQNPGY